MFFWDISERRKRRQKKKNKKNPVNHGHPQRYYIFRVEIKLSVTEIQQWSESPVNGNTEKEWIILIIDVLLKA